MRLSCNLLQTVFLFYFVSLNCTFPYMCKYLLHFRQMVQQQNLTPHIYQWNESHHELDIFPKCFFLLYQCEYLWIDTQSYRNCAIKLHFATNVNISIKSNYVAPTASTLNFYQQYLYPQFIAPTPLQMTRLQYADEWWLM